MKKWYILKNDNSFGPYTEKELKDLFESKQINSSTIIQESGSKNQHKLSHFIKSSEPRKPLFKTLPLKTWVIVTLSFLFIGSIFLSTKTLNEKTFHIKKPSHISKTQFERIFKNLKANYKEKKHSWKFLKEKNHKGLWLLSNIESPIHVHIKFQSISKKILSKQPIEFEIKTKVLNRIKNLNSLSFTKGEKVFPGFYRFSINITNLDDLKKSHPLFRIQDNYSGKILLGSDTKKDIEKRILAFHKNHKKYESNTSQDIKMKYQTLANIAKMIRMELGGLTQNLTKENRVKFIKNYEKKYGAFFTSFVIENEKRFRKLASESGSLNTELVSHYSLLSKIAKNLGYISVEALDSLKQKAQIKKSFSKFDKMIDLSQSKLKTL